MNTAHSVSLVSMLAACGTDKGPPPPWPEPEPFPRCAQQDPLRQAFFGDLHVHTALSLDANTQATRLQPADAYAFARGAAVSIQPYDEDGRPLRTVQLDRPLDFVGLTDHAEFLGTLGACFDETSPAWPEAGCVLLRERPEDAFFALNALTAIDPSRATFPSLCGPDAAWCHEAGADVWQGVQQAAEAAYDRTDSCGFTSFVAYEWSGGPGTRNMHRNVIFRNEHVPDRAIGYFDRSRPADLWAVLREECTGICDVLTIPHNSNLSSGLMFETLTSGDIGDPAERAAMEPLVEVFQHKGDSECRDGDLGADELCAFEKVPYNNLAGANLDIRGEAQPMDFVQAALGEGLRFARDQGVNPYRYGLIASTDTHLGTPGLVDERTFPGHGGAGHPNRRPEDLLALPDNPFFNPGGLVGLWAEENSREGLFQAMRRREAFGTSGPRIPLRFFGGDLPSGLCDQPDLLEQAYGSGVPMGSTLTGGPTFLVWAQADPGSPTRPAVNLQRLQIVKGWLDGDEVRTAAWDVAGDHAGSVDAACLPDGAGSPSLCATWTDPDPVDGPVFWYARAVEVPTCRWTAWQCLEAGITCPTADPAWEACCDGSVPSTIQERAWSSPIWSP